MHAGKVSTKGERKRLTNLEDAHGAVVGHADGPAIDDHVKGAPCRVSRRKVRLLPSGCVAELLQEGGKAAVLGGPCEASHLSLCHAGLADISSIVIELAALDQSLQRQRRIKVLVTRRSLSAPKRRGKEIGNRGRGAVMYAGRRCTSNSRR